MSVGGKKPDGNADASKGADVKLTNGGINQNGDGADAKLNDGGIKSDGDVDASDVVDVKLTDGGIGPDGNDIEPNDRFADCNDGTY